MKLLIKDANVFNNHNRFNKQDVLIDGSQIVQVEENIDAIVDQQVNATGQYLIPGLIDSHVHTNPTELANALKFGVTTEIEMMGWSNQRKITEATADVISAGMGVTAKGGHPSELHKGAGIPKSVLAEMAKMTPEERQKMIDNHKRAESDNGIVSESDARAFVDQQIESGADFIKVMLDDGKYEDAYPLPVLPMNVLSAAVDEAHQNNKLVLAHALEQKYASEAIDMGVDGLAHLFLERDVNTDKILQKIIDRDVFIVPCLCLNASLCGILPTSLIEDTRVTSRLNNDWLVNLKRSFNTATQMNFKNSLDNVKLLYDHSVKILAGIDVSQPAPNLGGLAHGASVHHELQLLVQAGMSTSDALKAATTVPAEIFGLNSGMIKSNKKANLLLLNQNPLADINNSLSIQNVIKDGKLLLQLDAN